MSLSHPASARQSDPAIRLLLFAVLAPAEMAVISLLFEVDAPHWGVMAVQHYIRQFVLIAAATLPAFAVIVWPKRQALAESWNAHIAVESWRTPLAVNLALFSALAIATIAVSHYSRLPDQSIWGLYSAHVLLLAATGISLAGLAAPLPFWLSMLSQHLLTLAIASGVALAAMLAGHLAQGAWSELSGATLKLVHALLSIYETDVRVDFDRRVLSVGTFKVFVDQGCSGYEGIGLVLVFLGLYLWVFRSALRFPNALLLLPIGVATIWLLNAVRIAALVSIGAHTSPEIAVGGFHSQAGWITFLTVTVGILATVPRLSFFTVGERTVVRRTSSDRLIVALLAPFMCLMAASIVMAAMAPYDKWFYGLKVVAVGACLWIFRDVYRGFVARVDAVALAAGAAVGVLWIVTAPATADGGEVGAWIATQSVWLAALWLVLRAIGSIVMVPIAEEFAFRGLLHRWLISRDFETVDFAAFSWLAFVVSSLLFGFMHQRWIAGALAGAVFALVMYRSGRLSDPIAAHMTANAIIIAWAIAAQNWSLL
jgi:exosortase E/protease (VPEID-CTERM system)